MDAISVARLAEVHPELARRVSNFAAQLGFDIRVTQGIRTVAQQDALYAQGRTALGPVVTNAKGTESNHVMGLAVDVVPLDQDTGAPDWNASHPSWQRIVALAPSCGLRDGISWKDEPHLELADVPPIPSPEMQQAYIDGGVQGAWGEIPGIPGPGLGTPVSA
jgi:peptidoglycan LD-endopeptidase CwlK